MEILQRKHKIYKIKFFHFIQFTEKKIYSGQFINYFKNAVKPYLNPSPPCLKKYPPF